LPVLLLGRLAVDKRYHNQGIGQALLRAGGQRLRRCTCIRPIGSRSFWPS
jgi:predicted N-acetyltransferase YhbS